MSWTRKLAKVEGENQHLLLSNKSPELIEMFDSPGSSYDAIFIFTIHEPVF